MTQPADIPASATRLRVVFSGYVQGVGFRATARRIAGSHSVSGWVRNEPDGTVTLEAQGSAAEVERFLSALEERMSSAIRGCSREAVPVLADESGFEIRR